MDAFAFRVMLAMPFVALAALWLLLALRHALQVDPDRAARAARRRLVNTLAALGGTSDEAARRRLIKAWQHDTGLEWKLDRAVPVPASFGAPGWRRAYTEADAYLYGPGGRLPGDWLDRARALHEAKPPPSPFAPRIALKRRHLFPLAAIACALMVVQAAPVPAAFAARSLEQTVAQNPLDWVARYNLARRAGIARHWERAASLAGIAWVQQPRNAATRALWQRAAREAAIGSMSDGGLPQCDNYAEKLAAMASPAEWQMAAIAAALALACGGAALLLVRFGRARGTLRWPAVMLVVVGAGSGAAAAVGLHVYGPAASPRAALTSHDTPLRLLPIDTPEEEAPVRLAPGMVAVADGRFLGWVHVSIRDGKAGWTRADQLLPLWRSPRLD